jgi:hypothetical protein
MFGKTLTNEQRVSPPARVHQRRWLDCCIMLGEMDDGGLMRVRVSGFTMGIGVRDRMAEG